MRSLPLISLLLLVAGCSKPAPPPAQPPAPAGSATAESTPAEVAAPDLEGFKTIESNDGAYVVAYRQKPEAVPLNDTFDLEVWVLDDTQAPLPGHALEVDARMPHHRHGMNLVPEVVAAGDGRFDVHGMLFHMPGYWEIYFDITSEGLTERAQTSIVLE
jgi:hypothetical protein